MPVKIRELKSTLARAGFTMKNLHYSMVIEWDDEDKIFVVTVPELPGCRTHGRTYEEAIKQGQEAIEGWIMTAKADNAPIPPPRNFIAA